MSALDALLTPFAALDVAGMLRATTDYASANRLEAVGATAGLGCVALLIRQSIWNWPLGLLYSGISVYLALLNQVYGQVALNSYFLLMNAYGWWLWLRPAPDGAIGLPVSRASVPLLLAALAGAAVGVALLATLLDQFTSSRYPLLDVGVTVLSIAAMWLQARKKLESWHFWFVVNLASVLLYLAIDMYFYVLVYAVYVPMAIDGLVSWRRELGTQ